MIRRLAPLPMLVCPLWLSGCFICVLKSGTGEHVGVVEEFIDENATPEPLPPPLLSALKAVENEGRPAIVIRYRVSSVPKGTGVEDYFGRLLEERRLARTVPYMLFNGIPVIVGGPPPGATASPHELELADLGLWISFGKDGVPATEIGWWHIGRSKSLNLTTEVFFLRGRILDSEPPVFEVAEMISLGCHSHEGEEELTLVPGPADAMAVLARNAETLETLNVLWVSPEDRKTIHREGYEDQVSTDASDDIVFERAMRKKIR